MKAQFIARGHGRIPECLCASVEIRIGPVGVRDLIVAPQKPRDRAAKARQRIAYPWQLRERLPAKEWPSVPEGGVIRINVNRYADSEVHVL